MSPSVHCLLPFSAFFVTALLIGMTGLSPSTATAGTCSAMFLSSAIVLRRRGM